MRQWTADFVNDSDDDNNTVVEVLCGEEYVALIKHGEHESEFIWQPNKEELRIPLAWLSGLLLEADERVRASREV